MKRDQSQSPEQNELPAPEPCRQAVSQSRVRKGLIVLGGIGATSVLVASLSGLESTRLSGDVVAVRLPASATTSAPASATSSAPVAPKLRAEMIEGDVAVERLVPASAPATQPVALPGTMPASRIVR